MTQKLPRKKDFLILWKILIWGWSRKRTIKIGEGGIQSIKGENIKQALQGESFRRVWESHRNKGGEHFTEEQVKSEARY